MRAAVHLLGKGVRGAKVGPLQRQKLPSGLQHQQLRTFKRGNLGICPVRHLVDATPEQYVALVVELLHFMSAALKNLETHQLLLRTILISEPVNIGFKMDVVEHSIGAEKHG